MLELTTAHPIFNIPEILRLICEVTRRDDLFRLSTVSRRFFVCVAPLVWASVGPKPLCKLALPSNHGEKIDASNFTRADLQLLGPPLNYESLDRFNLYAPYVRELKQHFIFGGWDRYWEILLRLVPMRPLLPNLRVFTLFGSTDPMQMARILDALICPTLLEMRTPGRDAGCLHPVFSSHLASRIAESCPNIHTLELYTETSYPGPLATISGGGSPLKANLFASLGCGVPQLCNLHTFGAGPEVLCSEALALLGSLPNLESLTICIPYGTPEQNFPPHFPPMPNSFPALQHMGIYSESTPLTARLWRTLPIVCRVTSVYIKVVSDLDNDDEANLVCSICQFSPNIIDLHLDFASEALVASVDLLTPAVISHFGRLPLRRVRIITYGVELSPPYSGEQLAFALSGVEYLDLQYCYLTLEDLAWMASHMPKLQFLLSTLELPISPPILSDQLPFPAGMSPSPSTLYLESMFTADFEFDSHGVNHEYAESIARVLHALWPNGVHCEFSDRAKYGNCTDLDIELLKVLNMTIKQLCLPKEFDIPVARSKSATQWKYINDRQIRWLGY